MGNYEFNETKSLVLTKSDIEGACVYVYWLGSVCQYVGQSSLGLCRPVDQAHTMRAFEYDRLEVFNQPDAETAKVLEEQWIRRLQPIRNLQHVRRSPARPSEVKQIRRGDQHIVVSADGTELFRSPEKHLAIRFRGQELKRIGDRRTRERNAHEANTNPTRA